MKKIFFLLLITTVLTSSAFAAEFRVTPIRVDFDKKAKSAVINVSNDGEKANLQIYAMEWTQDKDGKDKYTKTEDIIFFPKIMILKTGESRIIRVGTKMSPPLAEKTYRLFIEEIPTPKKKEGVNITIAVKFGVPIFVRPAEEKMTGEIRKLDLSRGTFKTVVKNSGTSHFNIESVTLRGKGADGSEIFTKELAGWYLLNGVSRTYSTEIPKKECSKLSSVDVKVKTDQRSLDGKLDVKKEMCGP